MHSLENLFGVVLRLSAEAAVLSGVIWIALLFLRKWISPAWRYAIWALVATRLLLPAGPESSLSLFNGQKIFASRKPHQRVVAAKVEMLPAEEAFNELPEGAYTKSSPPIGETSRKPWDLISKAAITPWSLFVMVWLTGLFVMVVAYSAAILRLKGTLPGARGEKGSSNARSGRAATDVMEILEDARQAFRLRRGIEFCESAEARAPGLFGIFRPQLLFPRGLADRLSAEELRHICFHEAAHVKRADLIVNAVMGVLQAVHWFNPFVWLAFSRMRAERELACDEMALAKLKADASSSYGETILKLVATMDRGFATPLMVGILEGKGRITERIRNVAGFGKRRSSGVAAVCLLIGLGLAGLSDAQSQKQQASEPGPKKGTMGKASTAGSDSSITPQESDPFPWKPWSPEAVQKARDEAHPLLVDVTADWCVTAIANRKSVIESPEIRKKLAEIGAICLSADYTRIDPQIQGLLEQHKRAGIPLTLFYPRNRDFGVIVLPAFLTKEGLLAAVDEKLVDNEEERAHFHIPVAVLGNGKRIGIDISGGGFFVNGDTNRLDRAGLRRQLEELVRFTPDLMVTLRAQPQTPFSEVAFVTDLCRTLKITNVTLSDGSAEKSSGGGGVGASPERESEQLYTRALKVSAENFLAVLKSSYGERPEQRGMGSGPAVGIQAMVRNWVTDLGIKLAPGESVQVGGGQPQAVPPNTVFFNDRTGLLMARLPLADFDKLESAIAHLPQSALVQIEAKICVVDSAPGEMGDSVAMVLSTNIGKMTTVTGIMSDPQFKGAAPPAGNSGVFPTAPPTGVPIFPGAGTGSPGEAPTEERPTITRPALQGILAESQRQVVLKALEQKANTEIVTFPTATAVSGRVVRLSSADNDGSEPVLDIDPVVERDGLTVRVRSKFHRLRNLSGSPGDHSVLVDGNVKVRSGQTIVLGTRGAGVETAETKKVAVLGDIPGYGRLFRSTQTNSPKQILIFITPRVLEPNGTPRQFGKDAFQTEILPQ